MFALLSGVLCNLQTSDHIFVVQSTEGCANPPSSLSARRAHVASVSALHMLRGVPACGETPVVSERNPPAQGVRKEAKREVVQPPHPQKKSRTRTTPNPCPDNRRADTASAVTCSSPSAARPLRAGPCAAAKGARVRKGVLGAEQGPPRRQDPAAGAQPASRVNRMGCFFKTEPVCVAQVELTLSPECFCFHTHKLPSVADIRVL